MSVVEEAKRLYTPFIEPDELARVEELDEPDQAYFWAYLYYEMPRRLGRAILKDMERDVIDGKALMRPVIRTSIARAKSLDALWDTTKPHSWFKAVL